METPNRIDAPIFVPKDFPVEVVGSPSVPAGAAFPDDWQEFKPTHMTFGESARHDGGMVLFTIFVLFAIFFFGVFCGTLLK